MNEELQRVLASIAAEDAALRAPVDIESRVMATFETERARLRRVGRPGGLLYLRPWAAAVAASALAGAIALRQPSPAPRTEAAEFTAIPFVAPLAPYERTQVVRMNMPASSLVAAGLDVRLSHSGEGPLADVLVGQDGRALAVRIVQSSDRRITNE